MFAGQSTLKTPTATNLVYFIANYDNYIARLERCCFGSLGIFGVLGCRVGCLSAFWTSPLRGSFTCGALPFVIVGV